MKRYLLLYVAIFAINAFPVHAEEKQLSEKMANVYKLLETTGAAKNAEVFAQGIFDSIFKNLKEARPDLSDRIIKIIKEESKATISEAIRSDEFAAKLAPIYGKYFSESEIEELVKFYSSPLGKRVIAVTPQLTKESMAVGEEWQKTLNEDIRLRVERRLLRENLQLW